MKNNAVSLPLTNVPIVATITFANQGKGNGTAIANPNLTPNPAPSFTPDPNPVTPPESTSVAVIDLADFDDEYDEAPVDETGGEKQAPDGTYAAEIVRFAIGTAQASGNPKLTYKFRVLVGPHAGSIVWKSSAVTSDTIRFIKSDVARCGLFLNKFSDLQKDEVRSRFIGIQVEIKKTTKSGSDFSNVYINRKIEIANPEVLSISRSDTGSITDEIPF